MRLTKIDCLEQLNQLVPLFLEAFNSEPYSESWSVENCIRRLEESYRRDELKTGHFFAQEFSTPVGFISSITQTWHDGVYVVGQELAVAQIYRGRGIASALVSAVFDEAKNKGCVKFAGETLRGSHAYDFWKKQGADFSGFEHFTIGLKDR